MSYGNINQLCDIVRETSFAIHKYHRNGHLEKVYENAMAHRLVKSGLRVVQQHPLTVYDHDGTILGEYFADLLVESQLIVELKACKTMTSEHVAQLLGYLKSSRIETGLLINFGAPKLQVKKYLMTPDERPVVFVPFCGFCGHSHPSMKCCKAVLPFGSRQVLLASPGDGRVQGVPDLRRCVP